MEARSSSTCFGFRIEDGGVDGISVGRDRERARRFAEQREDRRGSSANASAWICRIENQTSARAMPGVVSFGSPAPVTAESEGSVRCCPRCAVVMNARALDAPAKTMSLGSSPTRSVRTTCGGVVLVSTMLMLSDT